MEFDISIFESDKLLDVYSTFSETGSSDLPPRDLADELYTGYRNYKEAMEYALSHRQNLMDKAAGRWFDISDMIKTLQLVTKNLNQVGAPGKRKRRRK